jgi:pyroglutamyl-peptidase
MRKANAPLTILVTGFGPFPGAPFNPTGVLVQHLTRIRRPAFATVRCVGHVFPTSYAILDEDFPALLRQHGPDVVLMFGLASRTRHLRVETVARNILSVSLPDVTGTRPIRARLAVGKTTTLRTGAPCAELLQAARSARLRAALSRDAGRYLCNALYWRALEAVAQPDGPCLAAFIHVPQVGRHSVPRARIRGRRRISVNDLQRAAEAILRAVIAAARRH